MKDEKAELIHQNAQLMQQNEVLNEAVKATIIFLFINSDTKDFYNYDKLEDLLDRAIRSTFF